MTNHEPSSEKRLEQLAEAATKAAHALAEEHRKIRLEKQERSELESLRARAKDLEKELPKLRQDNVNLRQRVFSLEGELKKANADAAAFKEKADAELLELTEGLDLSEPRSKSKKRR